MRDGYDTIMALENIAIRPSLYIDGVLRKGDVHTDIAQGLRPITMQEQFLSIYMEMVSKCS